PGKKYSNGSFTKQKRLNYNPNFKRSRFGRGKRDEFGTDINIFIKKVSDIPAQSENIVSGKLFTNFEIAGPLKNNISIKGYTEPTPIQSQVIEPILQGRDLIGLA